MRPLVSMMARARPPMRTYTLFWRSCSNRSSLVMRRRRIWPCSTLPRWMTTMGLPHTSLRKRPLFSMPQEAPARTAPQGAHSAQPPPQGSPPLEWAAPPAQEALKFSHQLRGLQLADLPLPSSRTANRMTRTSKLSAAEKPTWPAPLPFLRLGFLAAAPIMCA